MLPSEITGAGPHASTIGTTGPVGSRLIEQERRAAREREEADAAEEAAAAYAAEHEPTDDPSFDAYVAEIVGPDGLGAPDDTDDADFLAFMAEQEEDATPEDIEAIRAERRENEALAAAAYARYLARQSSRTPLHR